MSKLDGVCGDCESRSTCLMSTCRDKQPMARPSLTRESIAVIDAMNFACDAVEAELELPGAMPDTLYAQCSSKAAMENTLRSVVRATKNGIKKRIIDTFQKVREG